MRAGLAALLLLAGSFGTHASGGHHLAGGGERLLAPAAEHPESAAHLEASASVLERGCPTCASLARGLAILATPLRRPAARERCSPPAPSAPQFVFEPLLPPAPPRGPPVA